jgi:hypothetical protein
MSLPRKEADGPEPVVAFDFVPALAGRLLSPAGFGIE